MHSQIEKRNNEVSRPTGGSANKLRTFNIEQEKRQVYELFLSDAGSGQLLSYFCFCSIVEAASRLCANFTRAMTSVPCTLAVATSLCA